MSECPYSFESVIEHCSFPSRFFSLTNSYCFMLISGEHTKTCSRRGWKGDEWVQRNTLQVYGRSTNRSYKCKVTNFTV
jgi:hypothetical protein